MRIVTSLVLLFSTAPVFASQYPIQEFEVAQIERIVVRGFRGDVNLTYNDQGKLKVQAVQLEGFKGDATGASSNWNFRISETGKVIRIEVSPPGSKGEFFSIFNRNIERIPKFNINLSVPNRPVEIFWREGQIVAQGLKSKLSVSNKNGLISAKDFEAPLSIETRNGEVRVKNLIGAVDIESYKGSIFLEDVQGPVSILNFAGKSLVNKSKGRLVARSHLGAFVVQEVKGDIEFDTIRGPVKLINVEGDVNGKTQEGSVVVRVTKKPRVRVNGGNGPVVIEFPKGTGFWGNIGTEKGALSTLPGLKVESYGALRVASGSVSGRNSGRIFVRAKKGSVRLKPY